MQEQHDKQNGNYMTRKKTGHAVVPIILTMHLNSLNSILCVTLLLFYFINETLIGYAMKSFSNDKDSANRIQCEKLAC